MNFFLLILNLFLLLFVISTSNGYDFDRNNIGNIKNYLYDNVEVIKRDINRFYDILDRIKRGKKKKGSSENTATTEPYLGWDDGSYAGNSDIGGGFGNSNNSYGDYRGPESLTYDYSPNGENSDFRNGDDGSSNFMGGNDNGLSQATTKTNKKTSKKQDKSKEGKKHNKKTTGNQDNNNNLDDLNTKEDQGSDLGLGEEQPNDYSFDSIDNEVPKQSKKETKKKTEKNKGKGSNNKSKGKNSGSKAPTNEENGKDQVSDYKTDDTNSEYGNYVSSLDDGGTDNNEIEKPKTKGSKKGLKPKKPKDKGKKSTLAPSSNLETGGGEDNNNGTSRQPVDQQYYYDYSQDYSGANKTLSNGGNNDIVARPGGQGGNRSDYSYDYSQDSSKISNTVPNGGNYNNGARPGIQGENGGGFQNNRDYYNNVYDYGAGNRGGTESGAGVGNNNNNGLYGNQGNQFNQYGQGNGNFNGNTQGNQFNQYGQGSGNFNGNTQGNGQGMNNNMGQNIGNENNQNNGGGTYPNGNQNVPPNRNPNQPSGVSKFFSNPVVGSVLGIGAGIGGMYALNRWQNNRNNKMMMKQYAMMNGQNPYEMRIRNSMMKQQWKDDARRFRNENNPGFFRRVFRRPNRHSENPYGDYQGPHGLNRGGSFNGGNRFNRGPPPPRRGIFRRFG